MCGQRVRSQILFNCSVSRRCANARLRRTPKSDNRPSLFSKVVRTVEDPFIVYKMHPIMFKNTLDTICWDTGNIVPAQGEEIVAVENEGALT